jgi:hypothetical protein
MSNVTLALEALGMEGRWVMLEGTETDIPDHPADLHPVATLVMVEEQ